MECVHALVILTWWADQKSATVLFSLMVQCKQDNVGSDNMIVFNELSVLDSYQLSL